MMDENSLVFQIFIFLFLGIFQVIGAVFIGLGVRQMLEGDASGGGQIFFGAVFAGAGTLFSALFMHELNSWGFPVSVMMTFFVILATMFMPKEILARFGAIVAMIGIGGFATFVGGMVLIGTLRAQEEILFGILFGGCWGSIGLAIFLSGVSALLRGKTLRFRQKRPGKYEIVSDEDPPEPNASSKKTRR